MQFSLRIEPELVRTMDAEAEREYKTRTEFIKEAIQKLLLEKREKERMKQLAAELWLKGELSETQLKKAPPELCLACHAKLADVMKKPGAKVHPPAAMGQCTFCHKPHESTQVDLLTSSPPGLCVTCHNTASEKIVKAHGGMQVKDANCVGCHDPHAAEGSKLFHPVQHKPFAGAVCTACHKK